ncbi:FAD-dependent oxidoreductase [Sanguibacter suaedae]|uniref:FAD-dependent monooxygenase n=1 Tax=Sanguibacter suaedae TaxID=2795737 RepID=A0A934MB12_9MICO|nr:NAD(P)/FAD-dependent oxidoreductase [Sanguibacter suaedae]MBI9116185.1 FAD-dependent monooxygenase [Sanguibacter suaedae]
MRDVVVIGAGPVGLYLAALLAHRGLDVAVWERRPAPSGTSRAIGIHPPSLRAFEQLDVTGAMVDAGVPVHRGTARTRDGVLGHVPFTGVSPRYPFVLTLPQHRTEEILARRLDDLAPGIVLRGTTLDSLEDTGDHVRLTGTTRTPDSTGDDSTRTGDTVTEEARFVVGADGARSTVRALAGIAAPLREYADTYVMADFADTTGAGTDAVIHLEEGGVVESFPLPDGKRRFVVHTPHLLPAPDADTVAHLVAQRTGHDPDAATSSMVSAFGVRRRLAARMAHGRVVLAGDAAHEISPVGGQGMNLGWADATHLATHLVDVLTSRTDHTTGLDAYSRTRLRSARRAAWQAEQNMTLGRPVAGARRTLRDTALRAALSRPTAPLLASVYAMRWA